MTLKEYLISKDVALDADLLNYGLMPAYLSITDTDKFKRRLAAIELMPGDVKASIKDKLHYYASLFEEYSKINSGTFVTELFDLLNEVEVTINTSQANIPTWKGFNSTRNSCRK